MSLLPNRLVRTRLTAAAVILSSVLLACATSNALGQSTATRWWEAYQGDDADGDEVLGFWNFDGG
ncbi:MAG: hypothetical protein ACF788_02235, partial [Novipirellula sp. JB048]